jgi:PKD repeat protein
MKKTLFSTLLFILYSSVVYSQTSCQAMFTYSGTGGSPNIISFTNSSSIGGNPIFSTVSYFWDFGDNNMDTVQNPIHTYINNGIYYPCLTITVVDPNGNACTSVYCDSILIGNAPPASWDCTAATGCYDPGTGNGQYTTLAACQSACIVTTSWNCSPNAIGCYDPGTGNGQYTTLAACQSACVVTTSWDCSPNILGCYDPGTGLGQYTSLASCQSNCGNVTDSFACMGGINPGITSCVGPGVYTMGQTYVTAVYSTMAACISDSCNVISLPASWDCAPNTPAGCYDPGTGLGQYTTLTACQAVCGTPTPSWDCSPANGCYDPGTGNGQYTTLAACQSACSSVSSSPCDSMTVTGSQYQLVMEVNNINTIIDYWVTSAPDGTVLQEDSMINTHTIYNYNPSTSLPYDTINTCITYPMSTGTGSITWITCCVTWIWNGSYWAKIGNVTSIGEINSSNKKIIIVVDVLGRETSINSNQTLFFIYEDGTIEKKIILE